MGAETMKLMNRALNLKIFIIAISVAFSGCAGISLPTWLTPSDDAKEEQAQKDTEELDKNIFSFSLPAWLTPWDDNEGEPSRTDTAESDKTIIEEFEKQSYENGKLKLEPSLKNGKREAVEKYNYENCKCITQEYVWKSNKWQLLPP